MDQTSVTDIFLQNPLVRMSPLLERSLFAVLSFHTDTFASRRWPRVPFPVLVVENQFHQLASAMLHVVHLLIKTVFLSNEHTFFSITTCRLTVLKPN